MATEHLPPESWYPLVIDLMLNDRLDFLKACAHAGVVMDPQTASDHKRRKAWRDAWDQASRKFYETQGTSDAATKNRLVGEMRDDATRLRTAGKFKEAADVTAAAAKILGYTSPDTSINFWDTLSGADIERVRKSLAAQKAAKDGSERIQ